MIVHSASFYEGGPLKTTRVTPAAELKLGHRAFHFRSSCDGHLVVASEDGVVSVLSQTQERVSSLSLQKGLRGVSVAPDGSRIVLIFDDLIQITDQRGNPWIEIAGPAIDASFDSFFRLWIARRTGDRHTVNISVYEHADRLEDGLTCSLDDPFGESLVMFPNRPLTGPIPIWVAGGQNGQIISWVELDGDILSVDVLDDFEGCCPPALSPTGDHFLLPTEHDELRQYDLLTHEIVGRMHFTEHVREAIYLDADDALVATEDGRIYRMAPSSMSIKSEVQVVGHEPRPTFELYPRVRGEDLSSDLVSVLAPGGAGLLSIHTVLPDKHLRQYSQVVWWSSSSGQT